MSLAFYGPLAAPIAASLLLALCARWFGDRLEPRLGTWLLTASAVAAATATAIAVALLAFGGVIRVPIVAWLGRLSLHVLRRGDPVPAPMAITAAMALAALAASVAWTARTQGRALVSAWDAARGLRGEDLLVVVPDPAVDAYALPALGTLPGHIVVSTGMLEVLTGDERRALLAHEQAHLAGRHYLFLLASRIAVAADPLLWPVAAAVAHAVERWADERAAARVGHRRLTACAIGKAALARHRTHRRSTIAWVLHAAAGSVPRRVAALLAPPPPIRRWIVLAVAALVAATCLAALVPVEQLHELLKAARSGH